MQQDIQQGCELGYQLKFAASRGGWRAVQRVENRGAEINFILLEKEGIDPKHLCSTPIHFAVEQEKRDMVKFLLAKGSDRPISNIAARIPIKELYE